LPAGALLIGLVLQQVEPIPTRAEAIIPWLALVLGTVGFFALGAAMPERFPRGKDFAAALPVVPLRFGLPFLSLVALRGFGVAIPEGAWVIALAPNAFMPIAMARLYGYDRQHAAAVPILAVPIAALLLPIAAVLGQN
jgi:predicted permease